MFTREFRKSLCVLTDKDENFVDCKQKDAAVFLNKFLNFIHEQYTRQIFGKISLIKGKFGIQIQKIRTCQKCQIKNINYKYYNGL